MKAKMVNEIGEATVKAVPFKYNGKIKTPKGWENYDVYEYEFNTIQGGDYVGVIAKYNVPIPGVNGNMVNYHFHRKSAVENGFSPETVNNGELFTIMSTNIAIIIDFIKKHDWVKVLLISVENDDKKFKTQRLNIYYRYIEKQLPKLPKWGSLLNRVDGDIESIIVFDKTDDKLLKYMEIEDEPINEFYQGGNPYKKLGLGKYRREPFLDEDDAYYYIEEQIGNDLYKYSPFDFLDSGYVFDCNLFYRNKYFGIEWYYGKAELNKYGKLSISEFSADWESIPKNKTTFNDVISLGDMIEKINDFMKNIK